MLAYTNCLRQFVLAPSGEKVEPVTRLYQARIQLGVVQRSAGGSACRRAAYQSASEQTDPRTGEVFDYRPKAGEVVHSEILLPEGAPEWAADRSELWARAELAETRSNSQTGRTFDFSIPREVPADLHAEYARTILAPYVEQGMAIDFSVHNERASDGLDQPHVSALATMRAFDPTQASGFERTKVQGRAWNATFANFDKGFADGDHARGVRADVEDQVNAWLEREGIDCRITLKSNAELGLPPPGPNLDKQHVRQLQRLDAEIAALATEEAQLRAELEPAPEPAPATRPPQPEPAAPSNVIQFPPQRDHQRQARDFATRCRERGAIYRLRANKIDLPPRPEGTVREQHQIRADLRQEAEGWTNQVRAQLEHLQQMRNRPWAWHDYLNPGRWIEQFKLNNQVVGARLALEQAEEMTRARVQHLDSDAGRNEIAGIQSREAKDLRDANLPHDEAQAKRKPYLDGVQRVEELATNAEALARLMDDPRATPEDKATAKKLIESLTEYQPHQVPEHAREKLKDMACDQIGRERHDAKMEAMHQANLKAAAEAKAAGPPPPAPAPAPG